MSENVVIRCDVCGDETSTRKPMFSHDPDPAEVKIRATARVRKWFNRDNGGSDYDLCGRCWERFRAWVRATQSSESATDG